MKPKGKSTLEQLAAVSTAFVVKPVYTIIALIIAIALWNKRDLELNALNWAMLFFFAGENFCAANYLFTQNHDSHLLEYLHSLGMVLSFGFGAFALMEGIDRHALHYSDAKKNCGLAGFCRQCHKFEDVSCGLQSVIIFFGIAAAVVALLPLALNFISHPIKPVSGEPHTPISIRQCISLLNFVIIPCWHQRYS